MNWFQEVSCALVEVDETVQSHLTVQGGEIMDTHNIETLVLV